MRTALCHVVALDGVYLAGQAPLAGYASGQLDIPLTGSGLRSTMTDAVALYDLGNARLSTTASVMMPRRNRGGKDPAEPNPVELFRGHEVWRC